MSPSDTASHINTAITFTAVLKDSSGNLLKQKPVSLNVGSTVVKSSTTDNNGLVTFSYSSGNVETNTYTVVYAGDSTYATTTSNGCKLRLRHELGLDISDDNWGGQDVWAISAVDTDARIGVNNLAVYVKFENNTTINVRTARMLYNDGNYYDGDKTLSKSTYSSRGVPISVWVNDDGTFAKTYGTVNCSI